MNLRKRNSAATSSSTSSGRNRSTTLEELFKLNQFPSIAEVKEFAKKTNYRWKSVMESFKKRRESLQRKWDNGTLEELPWQMKRLQESLEDGNRTRIDEKYFKDLKDELRIDEKHIRDFFALKISGDSYDVSHHQLLVRTLYPSKRELKAEAKKTFRPYHRVRKWFGRHRDAILRDFKKGKLKELPRQMKELHGKYQEKPYITQKELEALVKLLNIEPKKIIAFFLRNRQNERVAGKKVMKEEDVPKLCHERCGNRQPCSDDDSEDENVEEMEDDSRPCSLLKNSRRQNAETTHKTRKRVEEDESEDEDSEDEDSISRNRQITSKSKQRIESEEDESSDEDNEPPRKKRPAGRRQMGTIRWDEDEFDEMAEDWELPPRNQRLGRSPDYDHFTPLPQRDSYDESRHQSRTSVSPIRRNQRRPREDAFSTHANTEAIEKCHRFLKGLGAARVRIHGEQFRDVVLPFDHSVDWENWTSAQTIEVADQLFPTRAVEFFKRSGVHSGFLSMFIYEIAGIFEGLGDHNEGGHFTREMFDAFGDNIRKINELMKEKAARTSSRSRPGHVETSSIRRPAPRERPVSLNPNGPMRSWTDEQCLELARQFVPKKTLAVFKEWGLGRRKLPKIAEKDEESFEQLRTLDYDLNDKETLSWKMFEQFGEYLRGVQEMEWKHGEEDEGQSSLLSRPPTSPQRPSSDESRHQSRTSVSPIRRNQRRSREDAFSAHANTSFRSRPGYVETSSSNGTSRAPIRRPAPRERPVLQNPIGPIRSWTNKQCLEFANRFVPKMTLVVFEKWGLGRRKLHRIAEKDEESFEQLRVLDLDLNGKETLSRRMFEEIGEYLRGMQEMESQHGEEDEGQSSLPSRPPPTMPATLSWQNIVDEIKEEMEQD